MEKNLEKMIEPVVVSALPTVSAEENDEYIIQDLDDSLSNEDSEPNLIQTSNHFPHTEITSQALGKLFSNVQINWSSDGELTIKATKDSAKALAAIFEGMAGLLR